MQWPSDVKLGSVSLRLVMQLFWVYAGFIGHYPSHPKALDSWPIYVASDTLLIGVVKAEGERSTME